MEMKSIFLFFLSFTIFLYAQKSWHYQNPVPTSSELTKVQFVSADTGWAIGSSGTIIHTTNGGESWNLQIVDGIGEVYDISIINNTVGFAVGATHYPASESVFLKTVNSGKDWSVKTLSEEYVFNRTSLFFIDKETGWIADYMDIFKTTDGGESWVFQDSVDFPIHDLCFINDQIGWAVGGYSDFYNVAIYKTEDGGQSWIPQAGGVKGVLECVFFINENTGWVVGTDNIILKTEDGGQNWVRQSAGQIFTSYQLTSVYFSNYNCGFIAGWGKFLSTIDGGQNWTTSDRNALSVFFIDSQTGWCVGTEGTIQKTTDAGVNWFNQDKRLFSYDDLIHVDFTDELTGWAISSSQVYHTNNGGTSWEIQRESSSERLHYIYAVDNLNCWIIGNHWGDPLASILHTSDGGIHWENQQANYNISLNAACFTDQNTGWIVGDSGLILYTENSGQTWQLQESGVTENLTSLDFISNNQGWTVSPDGSILHTINSGADWNVLIQDSLMNGLKSIDFIDSLNGWGVGGDCYSGGYGWYCWGYIYYTTNGGETWQLQDEAGIAYHTVKFINENVGWVMGWNGLYYTEDGGENWAKQTVPIGSATSLDFVNINHGWIVGGGGSIMHTSDGGVTFIDDPVTKPSMRPLTFLLKQNYPNPFNPKTAISYQLPAFSEVELSIYNLLGQKVKTLVSAKQVAGTYKVEWDATGFASGVYYYKIETDHGFNKTKKLVLIK